METERENFCVCRHYLEMTFSSPGAEPGALSLLCAALGWQGLRGQLHSTEGSKRTQERTKENH